MADLIPVLQIIHVSDLHYCDHYSDKAKLQQAERPMRMWLRKTLEKRGWLGWHEGTLQHDDTAIRAFEQRLADMKAKDKTWFPDKPGPQAPKTWIIDSGDATTFGDPKSMSCAHEALKRWKKLLDGCELLSVYGNHDAWPGTQPALQIGNAFQEQAELQRNQIGEYPIWREDAWINPLAVSVPNGPRIEVYRLNTVRFGWWENVRAVGRVDEIDLSVLCERFDTPTDVPTYRILVTHHPVAFPYAPSDQRFLFLKQMVLDRSSEVVQRLRNDPPQHRENGSIPYVHLMLSGHTHLGLPGQPLPATVKEAYQGDLGSTQLQLVAGSLILVRDRKSAALGLKPQPKLKDRKDFSQPCVFEASQQFQVLRFWFDPEFPGGYYLERRVFARNANDGRGFQSVPELKSRTFVNI